MENYNLPTKKIRLLNDKVEKSHYQSKCLRGTLYLFGRCFACEILFIKIEEIDSYKNLRYLSYQICPLPVI